MKQHVSAQGEPSEVRVFSDRPPVVRNSWFFKRDTKDACIVVTANWIARQSVWAMQCKVNGELVDACLADNIWAEAQAMISKAVMEDDPKVTATVTSDTAEVVDEPPPVAEAC